MTGLGVEAFPVSRRPGDPAASITGVGFLGAGLIFREARPGSVLGLTTAAASWAAAAVGVILGRRGVPRRRSAPALVLVILELNRLPLYRRTRPEQGPRGRGQRRLRPAPRHNRVAGIVTRTRRGRLARQFPRSSEHGVQHRRGQPAGERVLLAGVEAAEQRTVRRSASATWPNAGFGFATRPSAAHARSAPSHANAPSATTTRTGAPAPRSRARGTAGSGRAPAAVGRFAAVRTGSPRRRRPRPGAEPSSRRDGRRLVGETGPVHRCEQEVARAVPGEDPPGPVARRAPPARARPAGPLAAGRRTRAPAAPSTPPIGEARDLLERDALAPRDEPGARRQHHDLGLRARDLRERSSPSSPQFAEPLGRVVEGLERREQVADQADQTLEPSGARASAARARLRRRTRRAPPRRRARRPRPAERARRRRAHPPLERLLVLRRAPPRAGGPAAGFPGPTRSAPPLPVRAPGRPSEGAERDRARSSGRRRRRSTMRYGRRSARTASAIAGSFDAIASTPSVEEHPHRRPGRPRSTSRRGCRRPAAAPTNASPAGISARVPGRMNWCPASTACASASRGCDELGREEPGRDVGR